jgi:pyridoxamine 5'-phosphate oxidase
MRERNKMQTYQDVFDFVKKNSVCTLATVDGDQPCVRGFFTVFFDDDQIYFTTGAPKNVYRQLVKNPKVELCYLTPGFGIMLRIAGTIEIVDDLTKKQKLIEEKSYLKDFTADSPEFILLRLPHGTARFWTITDNMREKETRTIEF